MIFSLPSKVHLFGQDSVFWNEQFYQVKFRPPTP